MTSIERMTEIEGGIGPNAMLIRKHATRVINGPMPRRVRSELMAAVKDGHIGRLKRDGLLPEVFFHPDHKNGAKEMQRRDAEYNISCIAKVMA
jgi:hypothetical protein